MSTKAYLKKVAAMHGVRPALRSMMCGPFWWILLVVQAVIAPILAVLANINVPAMWIDYRDSLRQITSTRRAIRAAAALGEQHDQ